MPTLEIIPGQNSSSEETLFQLPPMKKALEFSSSDEEREQEWVDRSNTRMSMFEAATSVRYGVVLIALFLLKLMHFFPVIF